MKRLLILFMTCVLNIYMFGASFEQGRYESYGEVDLRGTTFTILPADESISANDPKFQWFAQQTAPYFILNGANYVTNVNDADLVLLLDYGIGETTPRMYNKPIWGQTGIRSSTSTFKGNRIKTTYTPSMGVVGYQQGTINQYRKHIELYLYNADTTEGMSLLWQLNMELIGESQDLQKMFPAMLYKFSVPSTEMMCRQANNTLYVFDYDWNVNYNCFLDYSRVAISRNLLEWRGLYIKWNNMSIRTYKQQEAKKCVIFPKAIISNNNRTRVYFYVMTMEDTFRKWKLSNLSNLYIEYNEKRYQALESWGLKKRKKIINSNYRTFFVEFERLPEEINYGPRELSIIEERDGKILQGWTLDIIQ